MASSNILIFDENKTNMKTDEAYLADTQRLGGVQTGIASSQLHNKTLYQVSLVSYAIAQLMEANGYDANDSDAVSTFVSNLSSSILQKVTDKATASEVSTGTVDNKWISPAKLASLFPLPVSKGGTGRNTLTADNVLVGNGTGTVSFRPIISNGFDSSNTGIPTAGGVVSYVSNKIQLNTLSNLTSYGKRFGQVEDVALRNDASCYYIDLGDSVRLAFVSPGDIYEEEASETDEAYLRFSDIGCSTCLGFISSAYRSMSGWALIFNSKNAIGFDANTTGSTFFTAKEYTIFICLKQE